MLKVLQLIPTLDRSGAEKQMVLLAKELPRDRFEVEVAALTRLGPLAADLSGAGVSVTLVGKRFKIDPFAIRRLRRLLERGRFDVLHTWIFAANVHGRLAARRATTPVVITSEMAVDLWKSPRHYSIDRRLAQVTDRVVGNSQAVVDFYRETVGIPAAKLQRIDSGIADEELPALDRAALRNELGIGLDAPVALYAGRLAEQKCVSDLIDAADLLQHIRPNLVTLIVGDGPELASLKERAYKFTLLEKGRVRFLGHREDVPRLMAAADCVVLPSRYEGMPNVVLEAMRYRLPVIATNAPGTNEVVVDGETGRLVPIGDKRALASAMRGVIDDPEMGKRLGEAGRLRVEQHFRAADMVERFATLYESIARSKGLQV